MKAIVLVSDGIDSPVATGLALKDGVRVIALHIKGNYYPFEPCFEKVKKLMQTLSSKFNAEIKLCLVSQEEAMNSYCKSCNKKFTCIFCKRNMLRIASKLAETENASAILVGDSLGQVASQTLSNLKTVDKAASVPVIRPLIGMDKLEIESIARKQNTFEISRKNVAKCLFVPERPATKSSLSMLEDCEKLIRADFLAEKSLKNTEIFEFAPQ